MIAKHSMGVLCALGFLGANSGLLTAHQVSAVPERTNDQRMALAPVSEGKAKFGATKPFNEPLPVLAGAVIEDKKMMTKTKSFDGNMKKSKAGAIDPAEKKSKSGLTDPAANKKLVPAVKN